MPFGVKLTCHGAVVCRPSPFYESEMVIWTASDLKMFVDTCYGLYTSKMETPPMPHYDVTTRIDQNIELYSGSTL